MSFPVGLDRDRSVTRGWGVVALPSSFLLDGGHRGLGFAEGDLAWDDPGVDVSAAIELIEQGEAQRDEPT